jgi:hypothetical protein
MSGMGGQEAGGANECFFNNRIFHISSSSAFDELADHFAIHTPTPRIH